MGSKKGHVLYDGPDGLYNYGHRLEINNIYNNIIINIYNNIIINNIE